MASTNNSLAAKGITDSEDRLLSADAPLAELHERCGGEIPGKIAVPELLDLVRQGRLMGLKLAREFAAYDGEDQVSGFVRVNPLSGEEGGGCEILVENWRRSGLAPIDQSQMGARLDEVDRASAELFARLDREQRIQTVQSEAPDLRKLVIDMRTQYSKSWLEFVDLANIAHQEPLHWRLLDGCDCRVEGSDRNWRIRILPIGGIAAPQGFELLLVAEHPLTPEEAAEVENEANEPASLVGEALTPSLRAPIARIIANAETIRTRLAGPLRQEYSDYAADISSAGQHLLSLLDDLGDLELVEAPDFETSKERIDLADAARRAAGILSGKAREKGIAINVPTEGEATFATGEYRRVLQIMLNLLGNAISYSPNESEITLSIGKDIDGRPSVSVADQGPGLTEDQQERIFKKFERLGREGDGGSGLGLYISQRLANAMDGELEIASAEGEGTRFTLTLPEG
jgi:signal transduction histidine kinase